MVAGEDDPPGFLDGNPAGGFKGLGGFVDKQSGEFLSHQHAVGTPGQRAGDDPCVVEQAFVDGDFQFGGPVAQPGYLLVEGFTSRRGTMGIHFTDGLADGPELRVRRMGLETPFVGVG